MAGVYRAWGVEEKDPGQCKADKPKHQERPWTSTLPRLCWSGLIPVHVLTHPFSFSGLPAGREPLPIYLDLRKDRGVAGCVPALHRT